MGAWLETIAREVNTDGHLEVNAGIGDLDTIIPEQGLGSLSPLLVGRLAERSRGIQFLLCMTVERKYCTIDEL